jgi:Phage head-tail joining protein
MTEEHYNASDLVEPFYFTRPSRTTDGAGGFTETTTRFPTTGYHFAKVRPLRGTERLLGDGLVSVSGVMFVVWSDLGILVTDTLVYKDVAYNIRRTNVPGNSAFQEIEAEEGVAL